jgi:short-subunit dehydrogenase/acyl carrier protein
VFDSRTTDFAEQVLRATHGRGVDIVLNSLSGDKLEASLSALAFNGRFIEVGKRDIYSDARLSLQHFRKSIAFFAVDMASLRAQRPALFRQILDEVSEQFDRGWLEPLPMETFPASAIRDAFEHMARAEHVGKIVVDMRALESVGAAALPDGHARADGTYVISGGLGALGRAAAEWLIQRGARDILLLGRSRPSSEAEGWLTALRDSGVRVRAFACDVGSWPEVSAVFETLRAEGQSVRGIIHAAGILDDATLQNLTLEQVERVFLPKVRGAYNLHRASENAPLDFFVLYSSVASLLGSAGQAAYCAANACLDALARHRVARGLPATAINWGPVSEVGLAAAAAGRGDRLAARGLTPLSVEEVVLALEQVLVEGFHEVAVTRLDSAKWREAHPMLGRSARWSALLSQTDQAGTSGTLRARLSNVDAEAAQALLKSAIRTLLASVLRCSEERIGDSATFGSLGLDSLLGLELRARLSREIEIDLPATVLWRFPTIDKLAKELWGRAGLDRLAAPEPAAVLAASPAEETVTSTGADLARDFDAELARAESLT